MPELTRRRYLERPDCWHVYYGDIHAGTIMERVDKPHRRKSSCLSCSVSSDWVHAILLLWMLRVFRAVVA
jgi:hypothetical protein